MVDNNISELAYKLNEELLTYINNRDLNHLNSKYGITSEMFKEIEEAINNVGIDLKKTSLKITGKLRDIWEFNEGGFGIEADLITIKGERTDLTLTTELKKSKNKYKLGYRIIEIM